MSKSSHHLHVAALIPPSLTKEDVIEALHDHSNCLTLQALTTGHTELPETPREVLKDTYWYPVDTHPVRTYSVTEGVIIIPGVGEWGKKYIKFPSCFQNTAEGIRTRADTNGVLVRAEWRVMPGGAGLAEVDGEGEGIGYADWVLVEDVSVECAWYLMPFVKRSMTGAHQDICRKLIEKVVQQKMQEQLQQGIQGGPARRGTDKELPATPDPGPLPSKITYR